MGTLGYLSPEQARGTRRTRGRTSSRWGRFSTRRSRAGGPSRGRRRRRRSRRSCTRTRRRCGRPRGRCRHRWSGSCVAAWRRSRRSASTRRTTWPSRSRRSGPARRGGARRRRRRDDEPVPRPGLLHRGGRGPLLRAGRRGRGALAAHPGAAAPRGDRALGGGQDVLRARGCGGVAAVGLGGGGDDAGDLADAHAGAGPGARAAGRRRGAAAARAVRGPGEAFETLVRWRKAHAEALLVVDQFEELFTLCSPEAQARFAALLGRLAGEAGVHVLLSMRDDFLMRCHEHEALAPVFAELTPLGPLAGEALRRALEEPAKAEGFRFEEGLVGKMTGAVEGERGALPLLAFAVSRLWEKRDRERKLLTQEAYAEIGGVAGALARHAEATLERIGAERQGMVREVFRNLVTSQGTRAACDREELLSVFPDRKAAEEVLGQLVAARLLTSWEMPIAEGAGEGVATAPAPGRHRIEIVHESLLRSWLRLVRWQAQDAEGSLLRDQLKQAAHLWDEKGRPADLLWSGTSFREYAVWRERYPGALTAIEEAFARAMTERARRRRRVLTARRLPRPSSSLLRRRRSSSLSRASRPWRPRGGARPSQPAGAGAAQDQGRPDRGARLRHREPRAGRQPGGPRLRHEGPLGGPSGLRPAGGHVRVRPRSRRSARTAGTWRPPATPKRRASGRTTGRKWPASTGHGCEPAGVQPGGLGLAEPARDRSARPRTPPLVDPRGPAAADDRRGDVAALLGRWDRTACWRRPSASEDAAGHDVTDLRSWRAPGRTGAVARPSRLDGARAASGRADRVFAPSGARPASTRRATPSCSGPCRRPTGARDRVVGRHDTDILRIGPTAGTRPDADLVTRQGRGDPDLVASPRTGSSCREELRRPETAPPEGFWLELDGRLAHESGGRQEAAAVGYGRAARRPGRSCCAGAAPGTCAGADLHPKGDWAIESTRELRPA